MYSKLYIKYHCKREVDFDRYPPRQDDIKIWLEFKFLDKIKFRRPGRHDGGGRWRLIYKKEDLEDLKKESYDYYDGLDNFDKNITFGIDIDPKDLLRNESMYIPFTLKEVTSKVFYSLDDVLRTCGSWLEDEDGMIVRYKICCDPSTYNIELKKDNVIRRVIYKYKNLNKEYTFLQYEGDKKVIPELGESVESLMDRVRENNIAVKEEKKLLEHIMKKKRENEIEEEKKTALITMLRNLTYDEIQELIKGNV